MKIIHTQAFTLVELIVVITILAILGTIGFLSFQGYSRDARDSVRVGDLNNISRAMEFMLTKTGRLPVPDDHVEISASGTIVSYQGYAGEDVLSSIRVNNGGKDPKDDTFYTYASNTSYNKYQLLGFLENGNQIGINKFTDIYANLSERYPLSEGSELGIITDSITQEPIQITGTGINITGELTQYNAYLGNNKISGTGAELIKILPNQSCKRILELNERSKNGTYTINPKGDGIGINVYCDMETQGGGWTLAFKAKNGDNGNFGGNDSGECNSWSNDENNFCRNKYGIDVNDVMISAFKNIDGFNGAEYRSVITNLEPTIKNYFGKGELPVNIYVMNNPSNDFIMDIEGFNQFSYIPNRMYLYSGFYFNNYTISGHKSILINTHTNTDCDRVVVPGQINDFDTESIIGLFVRE